jgi:hypothetical protein
VEVEDGEDVVHPARMDQGPGHKGEEWYLEGAMAEGVDVFGQNGEGASNSQDGQGLDRESSKLAVSHIYILTIYNDSEEVIPKEETTYNAKITPHNPVLKTTSMVPQF